MKDLTVPVPDERIPEFYNIFAKFLAGENLMTDLEREEQKVDLHPWVTPDDLPLAEELWDKLGLNAQAIVATLARAGGKRMSVDDLSERVGIASGTYQMPGALSWIGRYSRKLHREFPIKSAPGTYWMEPDVAALFREVIE